MANPQNGAKDEKQSVKIASDLVMAMRVIAATKRISVQELIDGLLRETVERMKREALEQLR